MRLQMKPKVAKKSAYKMTKQDYEEPDKVSEASVAIRYQRLC